MRLVWVSRLTSLLFLKSNAVPEIREVGNHTLVFDTESTWNYSEAQQYCETELGRSLASFHREWHYEPVTEAIKEMYDEYPTTLTHWWFGMKCNNRIPQTVDGYQTGTTVNDYSNEDGTQVDSLQPRSHNDIHLKCECFAFSMIRQSIVSSNQDQCASRSHGLICNSKSNEEWQMMNPVRKIQDCNDNHQSCIINCTESGSCMRITQHIRDNLHHLHFLKIECGSNSCYGANWTIFNVSDSLQISCLGNNACNSISLSIHHTSDIQIEGVMSNAAISIAQVTHNAIIDCFGQFGSCRFTKIWALDISESFRYFCEGYASCRQSTLELIKVEHSELLCKESNTVSVCGEMRVSGAMLGSLKLKCYSGQSCLDVTMDVNQSQSVIVDCDHSSQPCLNVAMSQSEVQSLAMFCRFPNACREFRHFMLSHIESMQVKCDGFQSCSHLNIKSAGSAIQDLRVDCDGSQSCFKWIHSSNEDRSTVSMIAQKAWFDCNGDGSCFGCDDSTPMALEMSVECRSYNSCGFKQMVGSWQSNGTNDTHTLETSLNVVCSGLRSCVFTESVDTHCVSNIPMLIHNRSLQLSNGDLSLSCARETACDGITVNGYCSSMVSVEIGKWVTVDDLTVICPNNKVKESSKCEVIVKKHGRMKHGSVQMKRQDWDKDRYRLRGDDSNAFDRVTSRHWDLDGAGTKGSQCSPLTVEVGCYLEEIGSTGKWTESLVCSDFIMSLYSPVSVMILSLTALMGSLFLFSAVNQLNPDGSSQNVHWTVNSLLCSFFIVSLSAVLVSVVLQIKESKVKGNINRNDSDEDANDADEQAFSVLASLNLISFYILISAFELWLFHRSELPQCFFRLVRLVTPMILAHQKKKCSDWRSSLVMMCFIRICQMTMVYLILVIHPGSYLLCLILLLCCDSSMILLLNYKQGAWPLCSSLFAWMILSQFSPISSLWTALKWYRSRSFFEVMSDSDWTLVWFDLFLCEILFGIAALMAVADKKQKSDTIAMFIQLLDLSTDITVIIFWLSNGLIFWALCECAFVWSAALMSWIAVRNELKHFKEHAFLLSGLGRGYVKLRLWYQRKEQWERIDRIMSEMDSLYESQPSIILGLWLLMSDIWQNRSNTASMGPLIISMAVSAVSISSKISRETQKQVIIPGKMRMDYYSFPSSLMNYGCEKTLLNIMVFLFNTSDFIVRVIPLCVVLAISQGQQIDNERPSIGLISMSIPMLTVLLIEQSIGIFYASNMNSKASRIAALYAIPSISSCSAMFYGCFGMSGMPKLFDLPRFFRVHWFTVLFRSSMIVILALSVESQVLTLFPSFLITWLICLFVNILCGVLMQYCCEWNP